MVFNVKEYSYLSVYSINWQVVQLRERIVRVLLDYALCLVKVPENREHYSHAGLKKITIYSKCMIISIP